MLTDDQLQKLLELESKAAPAPWERGGPHPGTSVIAMTDPGCGHPDYAYPPEYQPIALLDQKTEGEPSENAIADADLIVFARNHLRELVEEVRRLRTLREKVRENLMDANSVYHRWDMNQCNIGPAECAYEMVSAIRQAMYMLAEGEE